MGVNSSVEESRGSYDPSLQYALVRSAKCDIIGWLVGLSRSRLLTVDKHCVIGL